MAKEIGNMSSALARQMEEGFGVVRQRAIRRYLRIYTGGNGGGRLDLGVVCDRCGVRVGGGVQGLFEHIRDRRCEVGCMERVGDKRWACMVCDFKARTQTSAYVHASEGCLENLFEALIPSTEGGGEDPTTVDRAGGEGAREHELAYDIDVDSEEEDSDTGRGEAVEEEVEWNDTANDGDHVDSSYRMEVEEEKDSDGGGKKGVDPASFDSRFVNYIHSRKGSSRKEKVYDQNLLDILMIVDCFMKCGISTSYAMFIVKVFKSIAGRESPRIKNLPVDWRTYMKKINSASACDRGGKKRMGGRIYSVGVPRSFNYKYDTVSFMCRDFFAVVKELLMDSNLVKYGNIKFDYDPQGKI